MQKYSFQTYSVESILRMVDDGKLKVPSFQRSIVWDESGVIDFLTSIYEGFPVGMCILLMSDDKMFETIPQSSFGFPNVKDSYPIYYIIDGVQRIASLYNCLKWKDIGKEDKFNVIFDLEKEKFLGYSKNNLPHIYVHLSSLFSPDGFIEAQEFLFKSSEASKFIHKANQLHYQFRRYVVAASVIDSNEVEYVADIFSRINSTGLSLTKEEIERARKVR